MQHLNRAIASTGEELPGQETPIRVTAERCVFDMPGYSTVSEYYEFSDGETTLVARSHDSTPEEVHFLARRAGYETEVLSDEELRSDLLQSAIEYLRSHGKSEFKYLNTKLRLDADDFYDHVPTSRPAA